MECISRWIKEVNNLLIKSWRIKIRDTFYDYSKLLADFKGAKVILDAIFRYNLKIIPVKSLCISLCLIFIQLRFQFLNNTRNYSNTSLEIVEISLDSSCP